MSIITEGLQPNNTINKDFNNSSAKNVNKDESFWGDDGFSFGDILDIINPLQHIPVISTIYRSVTGDELSAGSRVVGDAVFGAINGGLIGSAFGVVSAAVNEVLEDKTGMDIGEHVIAMITGDSDGENMAASVDESIDNEIDQDVSTTLSSLLAGTDGMRNPESEKDSNSNALSFNVSDFRNDRYRRDRLNNAYLEFMKNELMADDVSSPFENPRGLSMVV